MHQPGRVGCETSTRWKLEAGAVIVVVVETKVQEGLAEQALETARAHLRGSGQSPGGARQSRLFQGRDDPARFLYLGSWESREAYESEFDARFRTEIQLSLPTPVVPRYFRMLASYERILTPMEVVTCQVIEGPPSGAEQLRTYLLEMFEERRSLGLSLVLTTYCEEADVPGNFLMVNGWQSAEALAAVRVSHTADFLAHLAAAGATYRTFIGNTRFDSLLSL